jgi:hypothetical protein
MTAQGEGKLLWPNGSVYVGGTCEAMYRDEACAFWRENCVFAHFYWQERDGGRHFCDATSTLNSALLAFVHEHSRSF